MKKSFRWRLLLATLGVIVFLSIVFTMYNVLYIRRTLDKEYVERGTILVENLARSLLVGVLMRDTTVIKPIVEAMMRGKDMEYIIIYDQAGNLLFGRGIDKLPPAQRLLASTPETKIRKLKISGVGVLLDAVSPVVTNGNIIGYARWAVNLRGVISAIRRSTLNGILISILFICVAIGIMFFVTRIIVKPLEKLKDATQRIASGELDVRVDLNTEDEFGVLAESFNTMVDSLKHEMERANEARKEVEENARYLQERINEFLKIVSEAAHGDFTGRAEVKGIGDAMDELARATNEMFDNLSSLVGKVKTLAEVVATASEEVTATTNSIVEGTRRQEAEAAEAATSTEEMSATILSSAKNASTAQEEAQNSLQNAIEGGNKVREVIARINSLNETIRYAADKISALGERTLEVGEIINVIEQIAEQTNLLALNAAIEAARAGEYGRGFTVVADEVRNLAERSRRATGEIGRTLKMIQEETSEAVRIMNESSKASEETTMLAQEAGEALSKIVEGSKAVSNTITQIAVSYTHLTLPTKA